LLSFRTALIAALALLAALVGAPTAAAKGRAGGEVQPPQSFVFITMPGSNGWHLQLSLLVSKKGSQSIGVFARGPHEEEVAYLGVKARIGENETIEAKVPGLLHLALQFHETSRTPVDFEFQGCKAEGKALILKGIFRGTIAFHGEGGYTTVKGRSARGRVEVQPRVICPPRKHQPRPTKPGPEDLGVEYLLAGREEAGGGSLEFSAFATGLALPGSGPLTNFSATYTHRRGKLTIFASTKKFGEEKGLFSLTAPEGTPTEATVTPPAPFSGSATFKLESPTTASWTGDLSVEIPTLGTVSLAEPGWWAGACAAHCTKTFPPGLSIGFGTAELQTIH
jgi:hypothetical protein